jgi:excisionase family DNA binding protein
MESSNTNITKLFYNSKEIAEAIGLPVTSVQRLTREGKLPSYKLDRKQYFFKLDEVQKAIEDRRVN